MWSNLHVVDNESIVARSGLSRKIQPVVDTLSSTFIKCYSPGQELSVDDAMVKYKGCVGGKVVMPKKPVKKGFKIMPINLCLHFYLPAICSWVE